MSWQQRIDAALSERRAADTLRSRQTVAQGAGRWLTVGERRFCNFSSNDYLGLSQHPAVVRKAAVSRWWLGAFGSLSLSLTFKATNKMH